ncbi:plectin-like protein [Leptotrombidium deliense]|uniref:Plectin-like protein n=1 Tax=Leptotrombidium deliense TaxID=299467 RepID=A0A443S0W2_9ACAR|nr:plectin-like protein [Leptotrombidium deliense]
MHLRLASDYHQYYNEARECDQWLSNVYEKLNTTYSKQSFTIEEGELLLRECLRFGHVINEIVNNSKSIVPLMRRKFPLPRPIKVQ